MTPAEFDTRRRALGLSVGEVAAVIGVNEKSINRWTNGASPIKPDIPATLLALETAMLEAVDQAVKFATNMTDQGPVVLWRYRTVGEQLRSPHASSMPLGSHAMMIAWTADALEDEGIACRIEWATGIQSGSAAK